jgi:hypothetical protein
LRIQLAGEWGDDQRAAIDDDAQLLHQAHADGVQGHLRDRQKHRDHYRVHAVIDGLAQADQEGISAVAHHRAQDRFSPVASVLIFKFGSRRRTRATSNPCPIMDDPS